VSRDRREVAGVAGRAPQAGWPAAMSTLVALALAACGGEAATPDAPEQRRFAGQAMGTTYEVLYYGDEFVPSQLRELVDAQLFDFAAALSTYRSDSEVSGFNRAEPGVTVPVGARLRTVVATGLDIAERTDGAFDITVKALTDLYDKGKREGWTVDTDVRAALDRVGYRKLTLTADGLEKSVAGLALDVDSLAKGLGVDEVADLLEEAGVASMRVEIGGEVVCRGTKPDGSPWRIGVENPDAPGDVSRVLAATELRDEAMATSGTYRNTLEREGELVHHILDPRTGENVRNRVVSVAVVADSCMLADAWATAFLVIGPEAAEPIVRDDPRIRRALFVLRAEDGSLELRRLSWPG